jgi:hypothetical protein
VTFVLWDVGMDDRLKHTSSIDEAGGTRWPRINGEPANGAGLADTKWRIVTAIDMHGSRCIYDAY